MESYVPPLALVKIIRRQNYLLAVSILMYPPHSVAVGPNLTVVNNLEHFLTYPPTVLEFLTLCCVLDAHIICPESVGLYYKSCVILLTILI